MSTKYTMGTDVRRSMTLTAESSTTPTSARLWRTSTLHWPDARRYLDAAPRPASTH